MSAIILVTHNSRTPAVTAVGRLLAGPPVTRVVLVDNGSEDGTADAVRGRYPTATVIELGNLTDWTVAERAGRAFAGPEAPVVWLNEAVHMAEVAEADEPELVGV